MKGMALATVALALLPGTILVAQTTAPAPASTNAVARETVGRLLRRTFTDYTVMLFAPAGEP